jgi:hypothetical protein
MSVGTTTYGNANGANGRGNHPHEQFEDETIMHLERDQFVAETSRPVLRRPLSPSAVAALWSLRVFAVVVSLMVIYTFVDQLR